MTRDLREIRERVEALPTPGDDVVETVPDGSPEEWYSEDIERARDVLPQEKCDRLDVLLEQIDEQGAYEPAGSGLPDPTKPHKDLLCLLSGDAAESALNEMRTGKT